jgi:hypothetical protein
MKVLGVLPDIPFDPEPTFHEILLIAGTVAPFEGAAAILQLLVQGVGGFVCRVLYRGVSGAGSESRPLMAGAHAGNDR